MTKQQWINSSTSAQVRIAHGITDVAAWSASCARTPSRHAGRARASFHSIESAQRLHAIDYDTTALLPLGRTTDLFQHEKKATTLESLGCHLKQM